MAFEFIEIVQWKVAIFFILFAVFALLYRQHYATLVDAVHHSAMIQTLTGTSEPKKQDLKNLETIHCILAYALTAGFFVVLTRKH
jgi:hypothetical protein